MMVELIELNFKLIRKIDIFVSILAIFAGVMVIITSEYFHLNRSYLGVAALIPSIFYLYYKKNLNIFQDADINFVQQNHISLLLFIAFIVCFVFSIFCLENELYHRNFAYFIAISLACTIVASQILLMNINKYVWLMLFEIFLISINIRAGIYFNFPSLYGFDPNYHMNLIMEIVKLGKISYLPSTFSYYCHFPITHILVAITYLFSGMSFKSSFFLVSIIEVLSTVFVFLTGRSVFNTKVGLLAILILNICNYHILCGYWIIPMSLGVAFFSIVVYLILSTSKNNNLALRRSFIIIFLILIITTHTVSTFVLFTIVASFFGMNKLLKFHSIKTKSMVSTNLFLLFGLSFISYWMYDSYRPNSTFFALMIESIKKSLFSAQLGEVGTVSIAAELAPLSLILSEIGYSIFIILMTLGILTSLSSKYIDEYKLSLIAGIVLILSIIYIPSLAGINALLPARWFIFMYSIACIFVAFGIIVLHTKTVIMKTILVSVIIFALTFFMITTPIAANTDSPIYSKDMAYRAGFFSTEVKALEFLTDSYNGSVSINSRYATILKISTHRTSLDPYNLKNDDSSIIVIRNADLQEGFYVSFSTDKINDNIKPDSKFLDNLETVRSTFYDNGEVKMYT